MRALTKQEYSPQPKNILANPGQNPASITTSRENSREKPATNRKVTQESGHLSDYPSRGSFGTVIHPQHNVTKNGTDIQKSPRKRRQAGNTNQPVKAQGVSAAEKSSSGPSRWAEADCPMPSHDPRPIRGGHSPTLVEETKFRGRHL